MFLRIISKTAKSKLYTLNLFLFLAIISSFAQNLNNEDLIESFKDYFQEPRELVYTHINKSVFIKGETLAYTAYVLDKNDKRLSKLTTNLYCSIEDESGKTIKSTLVLVNEGVANGNIFIDSLFTSGNYKFKSYTNWMKNFEEQNFYLQSIKVIDSDVENNMTAKVISPKIDAQFLPEGGHLITGTENNIGAVFKDELGFGIPNLEGRLVNDNNDVVTIFNTNHLGIGKFSFTPIGLAKYKVIINFEDTEQEFNLSTAELYGITISIKNIYNKETIGVEINTNENTLKSIRKKKYKLTIHNGSEFKYIDIEFANDLKIIKYLKYTDLNPGINIFTLFNENNEPIIERLYFNYEGINLIKTNKISFKKAIDSTEVVLAFKDIDSTIQNNFSISVLPEDTISYNHHSNIISSAYLQPYVKGFIENASYYFTDINRSKQFELDNLLLTQGWSSYNWQTIFNNPPKINYDFEFGISFKATVNNSKTLKFILYPSTFNHLEIFEISDNKNTFEKEGLFPFDNDKINLSEIKKNDEVKKSNVFVQFYPSKVPGIENYDKTLPLKENVYFDSDLLQPLLTTSWKEYEQLAEVLIEVNKTQDKFEKLQKSIYGQVDIFDDNKRKTYIDFASYLRSRGYTVNQMNNEFKITDNRSSSGNKSPIVYIDNREVFDNELSFYNMDIIDYIVLDKSGFGQGFRGAGGVIKIFTDYRLLYKNNPEMRTFQEFEIPLTFSKPKTFYVPKYSSYQNRFYKEYGVVQWLPKKSIDEKGNISFKIRNQEESNIKLFIEGMANNGSFISETKILNIN